MMLFTTGNIDQHTQKFNLLNKRERRNQEKRMLSISRSYQTPMEFTIERVGKNQILDAMI